MYYKTVFEANLMQFYHGVEFYGGNGFKFEVIASCQHIFEPQVGDMVANINRHGWIIDKIEGDCYISLFQGIQFLSKKQGIEIIQRNGKAFIMPERE
jgi:uncharacterized protein (DUF2132 family)